MGAIGLALGLAACGNTGSSGPPSGREVFQSNCGSCHTLAAAGTSASIGPNLDQALRGKDRDFIRGSIVNPNAQIEEGFSPGVMPQNFEQQLSPAELDALVDFLAGSGSGSSQ